MALVELAGAAVERARISMPLRGRWVFEGRVTTQVMPAGAVTIKCEGGLELAGFVDPSGGGLFLDSAEVRVLGGAGGLGNLVSGAFQFAELRDPLQAILDASGEQLALTVAAEVLAVPLRRWHIIESTCAAALEALAGAATQALGQTIRWRILPGGALWLGAETWPAQDLPAGDAVETVDPVARRTVVAATTPSLAPGVDVTGIGKVGAVEHFLHPNQVRTWLMTTAG